MDFDFTLETITPDITGIITLSGNQGTILPSGPSASRPTSPVSGTLRIYTDSTPVLEYWNGTLWLSVTGSISGTTNQVSVTTTLGASTLSIPTTFTAPGYIRETSGLYSSTTTGIVAAGTTQGTATALITSNNIVSTAPVGSGVILPVPSFPGWSITVFNRGANSVIMYPNSGGQIDMASANTGIYIPTNQFVTVQNSSATQWNTVNPIYASGTGISLSIIAGEIIINNTGVTSITGGSGISASSSTGGVTLNTPITSTGDLIVGSGTNTATRLPIGTTGQILVVSGGTAAWTTIIQRVITSVSTATTASAVTGLDYVYLVSGTTTLTLPTAVGNINEYTVKNVGTNTVTIATTASQTIDGSTTVLLKVQYTSLSFISDGANWNIV